MAKQKKSRKKQPPKVIKTQSVAEFLASGGTITRVPTAEREKQPDVLKTQSGGPAVFLSLAEADLFYGEARKGAKPKKVKSAPSIDLNALPEALRAKFIAKLKEESDGEFEEDSEEVDEEDESSSTSHRDGEGFSED